MSGSSTTGLAAGARLEVTRGRATSEEALAVLLALDQATAADAEAVVRSDAGRRPGWREAARREQARDVVYAAAPDLTRARWP